MGVFDRVVSRFLPSAAETEGGIDPDRRRVLGAAAAGGLGLSGAKAVDNVLIGYGPLVGENLHTQDLAGLASEGLFSGRRTTVVEGTRIDLFRGRLTVFRNDRPVAGFEVAETTLTEAADLDAELGLPGVLGQVVRDVRELTAGTAPFVFGDLGETFERARAAEPRPYTTALIRGGSFGADPSAVAKFAGVSPADPEATLRTLTGAFRERTDYDVVRYLAGAVQFNLLANWVKMREPFENPVDWDALAAEGDVGLFCNEYAKRSVEALHSVAPWTQDPPVAGALVYDTRHRHVYTMAASVVREGGMLVVPATFLDYMHSTLYHDYGLTTLTGEGLEAYDRRHRATGIGWRH
jgi:hypothetical protein